MSNTCIIFLLITSYSSFPRQDLVMPIAVQSFEQWRSASLEVSTAPPYQAVTTHTFVFLLFSCIGSTSIIFIFVKLPLFKG